MRYIARWEEKLAKKIQNLIKDRKDAHDFTHCSRTRDLALRIAEDYPGTDKEIIVVASYLHDIGYTKASRGLEHCIEGAKIAREILAKIHFPKNKVEKVAEAVFRHEDFKFGVKDHEISLETKILQDADLVEGFGAIGLARFFMFAGHNNIPLWLPEIKNIPKIIYSNVSIIHNIDGVMKYGLTKCNTKLGKKLIVHRLKVMKKFVEEFKKEWKAEV